VSNFKACFSGDELEKYLIETADKNNKAIIFPVDDYAVLEIDIRLNKLNESYIVPNINSKQGQIAILMDKQRQKELAKNHGLPLLKSCVIKSHSNENEFLSEIEFPCFVKPNISQGGNKSQMRLCCNADELKGALKKYCELDVLCEEYADIKDEYSILGASTQNGVIAPAVLKVTRGGTRSRKGVAVTGELLEPSVLGDIIQKAKEYVKSLNYTGLFDIDLIQTKDGRIYFIELNFRAGASAQALTAQGVNLAKNLADSLIFNKPLNDDKLKATGQSFVSEKLLIEEYARGDINLTQVKKYMSASDIYFIKDENDKVAYRHFKKYYIPATLMRIIYKFADKIKSK
jgi:carbamoylphosphate synthase large subunit